MKQVFRTAIIAGLCLLLAGCLVRIAYSQADWLIAREINQYVSLDDEQSAFLDERLDAHLDWHCAREVPRYQAWFADLANQARAGELNARDVEASFDRAEQFLRRLAERIAPDAVELLATLSDEQVTELLDHLDEQQRQRREQYADPDAATRRAERVERMEERLERWYGRLNREQRARVEQWGEELAASPDAWLENRERWREALATALEHRDDPAAFRDRVKPLLTEPETLWDPEYAESVRHARTQAVELIVDVHELASERRQLRAARKLETWQSNMGRIACEESA